MTTPPQPYGISRLSAGYAARAAAVDTRHQEELARLFRPDERMEKLLAWETQHPDWWAKLEPTTRMAIGHYRQQKTAWEAELARQQAQETPETGGTAA